MLKSLEVWDFESHEHTLIPDLSEGLTVIQGPSNAGKTSLIRALKLAAFNDYDPKSLRLGAKRCKVRVVTDKGTVQVTKPENLWEITPNGGKTLHLSKVGVAVVPQAAEIMGLRIVKLGDVDVPVNIMDQLESHFMLRGIGDKKATGSIRAQIIDEISGLSGIETLITSVSLDNTRAGRAIKKAEGEMDKTTAKLHDEKELDTEERVLGKAAEHLKNHQDAQEAITIADDMMAEGNRVDGQISTLETQLKAIPDTDKATAHLDAAQDALDVLEAVGDMIQQGETAEQDVVRLTKAVAAIPDHAKAQSHLDKATELMGKITTADAILTDARKTDQTIEETEKRLQELSEIANVSEHLDKADQAVEQLGVVDMMLRLAASVDADIEEFERHIQENKVELAAAMAEQTRLLQEIKVCPLNPAHPVSKDCLKGVRTPVAKETK